MANVFEYASVFQSELDKAAVEQATSGWMELNDKLVRYNGGAEVKIPNMDMDGLADYDRDTGFVEGSVNLKWQTKEMTRQRPPVHLRRERGQRDQLRGDRRPGHGRVPAHQGHPGD